MKATTKPRSLSKIVGTSRRFLIAVAVIGVFMAVLQFVLVRQQVNGFLTQQMQQFVSQGVGRLQRQINQDQYLIEAVAGLQEASPDISFKALQQFIRIADHGQSMVSYIYLVTFPDGQTVESDLLIDMTKFNFPAPSLEQIVGKNRLNDLIRQNSRPAAMVLAGNSPTDSGWLLFMRPVGKAGSGGKVVFGLTPIDKLFADFIMLQTGGQLNQFIVSEQTEKTVKPFFVLSGVSSSSSLFASHEAHERIVLRDRTWVISFKGEPRQDYLVVAFLPYIILGIGLLLTWALVMYLGTVRVRGAEVANLAESLRKANDELNRRIAEEARMARAVRESEYKYRSIFENAGIGICQIAPSGEWIKANRQMAHILGYDSSQELLVAQPDLNDELFVSSKDRNTWFERLNKTSQHDFETEMFTKDRRIIVVNMSGHAVRMGPDKIQYFECTVYDVTERKNAEKALKQAIKEADFANRSKSEFLANMSHELRTPLNAIIGFSEIIKDQLFGPVGKEQYVEYAKDIYDSGELLLSLINDILDMSKIEAGKRTLTESEIDISETVRSVMRLVSVRAKSGRVHLNVDMPIELPHVRVEEKAIKQILTNLLTNAIKFTPEGGSVTLSARASEQGGMTISIEDTGIGMKPEDIPVALSPFGQIENVLSRKNQGTGLGLPLTKALIELHGGEMKLTSEVGKGTTVTMILPPGRLVGKPVKVDA